MSPLPKATFAGRLCRLRLEGGLPAALRRIQSLVEPASFETIPGTKWNSFWLGFESPLNQGDEPGRDGVFRYPFLARIAEDRYIVASTDSSLVDAMFERANVTGLIDFPRILVDKAARDLVFPPGSGDALEAGRRYALGAVYGAVEGYARALRNISFFGDDIAEAALFRYALDQIAVTRLTLRDTSNDKEIISFNTTGGLDFHFKGQNHLNSIDGLTSFFKARGYIEWRTGKSWRAQ